MSFKTEVTRITRGVLSLIFSLNRRNCDLITDGAGARNRARLDISSKMLRPSANANGLSRRRAAPHRKSRRRIAQSARFGRYRNYAIGDFHVRANRRPRVESPAFASAYTSGASMPEARHRITQSTRGDSGEYFIFGKVTIEARTPRCLLYRTCIRHGAKA